MGSMVVSHDLYFAAFLVARGCHVTGTHRDHRNRMVFELDLSPAELREYQTSWRSTEPNVSALTYADAIKRTKDRLFE
jgi:hypothetical protein